MPVGARVLSSTVLVSSYPKGSMYGIFTHIYHKNLPNVAKYTSPMDPMGTITPIISIRFFFQKIWYKNTRASFSATQADLVRFGAAPKINVNMWHARKKGGRIAAPLFPIPSMYGIFTYIWPIYMVNVGDARSLEDHHPRTWLGYVVFHSRGDGNIVFVPLRKWVVPLPNGHGVSWLCNNGGPECPHYL